MIFIGTQDRGLARFLKNKLQSLGAQVDICDPKEPRFLESLYHSEVSAIVADEYFTGIPVDVSVDILNSIGQRIPVVVLTSDNDGTSVRSHQLNEQLTLVSPDNRQGVLTALGVLGSIENSNVKSYCSSVPFFNIQIPINRLKENSGLGIISIDASSFSKVGLEYGIDVYSKLKEVFQEILFDLWGEIGSFRESDILCKKSFASNIYYLFLSRSRDTGSLPLPGALEQVADRLTANIQNALWDELSSSSRRLPECVTSIPLPSVGYVGILENPCIDPSEIIEAGIDDSRRVATAQTKRLKERQLELMQTLIQSDDLLTPCYQGVFRLKDINQEVLEDALEQKSIKPLEFAVYGFESLIRINTGLVGELIDSSHLGITGLETKYLRPDILFGMAKTTKVSLELDQACLRHAAAHSLNLPGILMVNILPRNLYYIDRLHGVFSGRNDIMFEVSESEAINNFELMNKSCALLKSLGMSIAADDFGKGFSSLERIIKIKPSVIKFDRSMIENIHADPVKQAYVRGMVEAAKIIKTTVLAEGVETWEEAQVLQKIGIELVQGYLFHRPSKSSDILEQLQPGKKVIQAS